MISRWKKWLGVFSVAALCAVFSPRARADEWNKATILSFTQPVEIPGTVLPAGTYQFKLMDSAATRNIVQVFDQDGTHVIATFIAIPDYRLEPTGESVIKFGERAADEPQAIRAWFYPGDLYGLEFVYPRTTALALAQANQEPVLAMSNDASQGYNTDAAQSSGDSGAQATNNSNVVAVTPDQKEESLSDAVQSQPAAQSQQPTDQNQQKPDEQTQQPATDQTESLPKTASMTPLIALLGLLSLGAAFGFGVLAKQKA
jgi:hypothetical protein